MRTVLIKNGKVLDPSCRAFVNADILIKNGVSRNAEGTIAGSCYSMAGGARKLTTIGFTLPEIARIGAYKSARTVCLEREVGSIDVGKRADITLCDGVFNVNRVLVAGKEVPLTEQIFTASSMGE